MSEILTNPFITDIVSVYGKLLDVAAGNKFVLDTKSGVEEALNNLSISDEKKAEIILTLNSNLATSTIAKTLDQSMVIIERSSKLGLENNLLQSQIDSEVKTIELKTAQIQSMSIENNIKQVESAKNIELKTAQIASMEKEDLIKDAQNVKDLVIKTNQAADIAKGTELKTAQIASIGKDNIIKDKQALKLDEEIDLVVEQINEMQESILDRQQKRPVEVANLTKQGTLIDGQIAKMTEDKLYVIAQKTSMIEQVSHNKIIKAMDSMADMIGTLGAGGLVPNSTMFGVYFRLNKLLTGEAEPTSYTVSKAT